MVSTVDVSWELDGITMEGTVVRPDGDGLFPAVVLVAGSGPTDRDWCSPLLPGSNGSGRLFAEAFARAGIASLRYDKRASGPHARDNVPKLIGSLSMQSHLDELAAAVQVLSRLDFVDSSRVIGLGNSEGALHVLHYATSTQVVPFAGIVLAAPPGRPIQDVLLSQLTLQSAQFPGGAELMPKVRAAAARYAAGEPMNPDPALPDSVKMVLSSFETPANLPFARELWVESTTDSLGKTQIPTLVLIGGSDVQIDMRADGDPLQEAAAGMSNVTFAFPPNANHVFKEDMRSPAEVAASPGNGYNDPDTHLDPESVELIMAWLRKAVDTTTSRT
ncbi:alpha/beta fold hydrolase [Paenarthrobacter sp. PH39-S1]|uniref:alpha/beta fold hydrolase n=1 Tax=Paenarthrobacter sp. PH39-S1 TaxID=3046204 RepID=UPI0024BA55A8|nr:alpha/beta fold hydrolase [Paenarthrobacter sp. PH39-S1]MDJ0356897.1 alpha/beta fold hydrolase [Paenarthrobacter sp. PH39-S1]